MKRVAIIEPEKGVKCEVNMCDKLFDYLYVSRNGVYFKNFFAYSGKQYDSAFYVDDVPIGFNLM